MISSRSPKHGWALALLGLALLAGPAHAASFDCKKASTTVEKAICADQTLGGLDDRVNESYRRLIDNAPSATVPALRDAQRVWLRQRNQCAPSDLQACLAASMKQRAGQLATAADEESMALDHAIADIPKDPAAAAHSLRGYAGPLASAWLVYLHAHEPKSGVTEEEARQRRDAALAGLGDDSYARDIYTDIESQKYSKDGDAPLTLLRMLIERAGYRNDGDARPYVHCFVFARQGDAAYRAFGSLYGSSRDAQAPICRPQGDLFEQPEWKRLEDAIEPVLGRASSDTGTIRYAYFADWSIQELHATVSPRDFLKPLSGKKAVDAEQKIRAWKDGKRWPAPERDAVLAALEPARHATAEWLRTQRGFDAAEAAKVAKGIVEAWLAERMAFIGDNLSGD